MPIFKSSRKVQEFGDSLALTLPTNFVKVHEVKKGSILKVMFNLDGVLVVFRVDDEEVLAELLWKLLDGLNEEIKKEEDTKPGPTRNNRRARQ